MYNIDLDLLKLLKSLSDNFNELLEKYEELDNKYFKMQINIQLLLSDMQDLKQHINVVDDKGFDKLDRIYKLIAEILDTRYIKGE